MHLMMVIIINILMFALGLRFVYFNFARTLTPVPKVQNTQQLVVPKNAQQVLPKTTKSRQDKKNNAGP